MHQVCVQSDEAETALIDAVVWSHIQVCCIYSIALYSLGPRPKTYPSTDCFQYRFQYRACIPAWYTGNDICAGWGLGTRLSFVTMKLFQYHWNMNMNLIYSLYIWKQSQWNGEFWFLLCCSELSILGKFFMSVSRSVNKMLTMQQIYRWFNPLNFRLIYNSNNE